MHRLVNYLTEYPIKYVTLYGFSTENWTRPVEEVDGLFKILADFIKNTAEDIHSRGVKLRHIGRLHELPVSLQESINGAVDLTKNNAGMTLSVAFNYGSRAEIIDAVRKIVADGSTPEDINEDSFEGYLYTAGIPNVDLLIRTMSASA